MARSALAASGTMLRRALFLGYGNHGQSRFCEELFNHQATAQRLNWLAFSRALHAAPAALNHGPMSPWAVEQLQRRGIRPVNHLRLPLEVTEFDFVTADCVIALDDARDRPALQARWPRFAPVARYWQEARQGGGPVSTAAFNRLEAKVRTLLRDLAMGAASRALA